MFSDVIIPDQHLARRTSGATRRGRWFQARAAVTGVVLLALFVFVASQAVVRGKMMLDRAQEAASTAALVSWDDQNAGASNLARVDALREEIHHLESSSVLGIGLQPRGRVLPAVRGLYQRRSREFVGRYPLRSIEENLEAAAVARVDSGSSQRLYDDLKAYLLLGHEVERLRTGEAAEDFRHFLVRHLTDVGFESFQTAGAGLGTQESADRVEAMASAFVSAVAAGDVAGFPTDERRVARARQILAQPLNLGGIYAQLRTRGKDRLPTLSLDDLEMPPQYRGVFASGVEIDGLYTRMGWDSFVQEEIRRLSRDPTRENWVLGRGDAQVPDELRNTEQVSARLTEIYFNEYSAAWQGLLRRVRIQPAQSVGEAADLLRKLGSADSPFLYLLALASDQTQFQGRALPTAAGGEIQERAGVAAVTHPVDRRFAWLHRMNPGQAVSGGAEAAPELYQALAGFQKLAGEFESLGNDEDALGFAATVLEQNGGVMETEWRAIQRTARAFDDRTVATSLFEAPVTDAWEVVLRAANRALSNLWQESVSRPYAQELAGRYPFAESDLDANVLEVDEFFNPQTGVLASFVGQRLKPFLTIDQRQAAIWNGRGLQLDGVLAALAQARHIEEGLFGQGGVLRVAFELRPGLPEKSANAPAVSQLYADIHGQRDTYNMGVASWRSFEWPAGAPLASISVSTQSGQLAPVSFGGDWALFRLLDAATVLRKTSSQYEVRWTFEQPGQYTITAMYELKAERATDLFHDSRNFFRFTPPPGVR
jgi:type VI secretion system protein ImpL